MEKTIAIWIWNFSILELALLTVVVLSFFCQIYYNLKYFLSATKGKKVE